MELLLALANNKFSFHSAALDTDTESSHIRRSMLLIESCFGYPVFVRGVKKYHNYDDGILGFTEQGQNLYFSIKTFLDSLVLIQKDNDNDNLHNI